MSICKCGEFIGLIHKSCRRCGRKSIIYNEKGSRQCPLPLAPATNQSKEYHKFGSRQRPPPPAPETNPSKGDHKFGSRQRPPPPAPETNPSKDDHKFGSSQRRPPPAPETNPSKDDLEFGSEQRPPPPAPETNPSKDDHKFVSKQRPSPPAPDTNRSKDDHKFGSRPLPPTPKSETNESNDAHRYDLRDNPPKPVVNIQDSQSKEEYADDKSDGLVGRKSQMVDAGYITPMHMDSDEGDEIKINKGNRSESEHDQEPVYDEVGKDTYTTMSAGNSGIIPETSHELKLPTIRLNGPLQSPESLISQLDDSNLFHIKQPYKSGILLVVLV
ncbi:uncharacterized protein LOC143055182 [Mytilus galloprovincialis]|uniref:uncharacterized protein LOC143055182 n=1 Tax=Mytilus galloprovincialis TaxID=29158 RepID=UPI003F7B3B76